MSTIKTFRRSGLGMVISGILLTLVLQGCQTPFINVEVNAKSGKCAPGYEGSGDEGIKIDGTTGCAYIPHSGSATNFWFQDTVDNGTTGHWIQANENLTCSAGSQKCRLHNRQNCPGGKKCISTYTLNGDCACMCGKT